MSKETGFPVRERAGSPVFFRALDRVAKVSLWIGRVSAFDHSESFMMVLL